MDRSDGIETRYSSSGSTDRETVQARRNTLGFPADDGPPGRIGIPQRDPEDRAWFLTMLQRAHPAISNTELAQLETAAAAYHQLLWNRQSGRSARVSPHKLPEE